MPRMSYKPKARTTGARKRPTLPSQASPKAVAAVAKIRPTMKLGRRK